jgi:hypothetical protein
MDRKFHERDTVKLKPEVLAKSHHFCPEGREDNSTSVIVSFLTGQYDGGVYLQFDLHGCKYWNVSDLELVKAFDADICKVSPIPCDFKPGDKVTFTNEYGVIFPGRTVIGFRESIDPDFLPDRFILLDGDAYWFPHKISELTKE